MPRCYASLSQVCHGPRFRAGSCGLVDRFGPRQGAILLFTAELLRNQFSRQFVPARIPVPISGIGPESM